VLAKLKAKGITPANPCSDEVFLRRVFVDVIGTLPKPQEVQSFLQDQSPNKRALLIDALLQRDEFADYWSLKWCDVLRVKSEFPINLWPNAVQPTTTGCGGGVGEQALRSVRARAADLQRQQLPSAASELLPRDPGAHAGRHRRGRSPDLHGVATRQVAGGKRQAMAVFFSRVAYKSTAEWKEEIVYVAPTPVPAGPLQAVFPDGAKVRIGADQDPRVVFADWLVSPKNPWFARSVANRLWPGCWGVE